LESSRGNSTSALRVAAFYKFLIRNGNYRVSPIKNLALRKTGGAIAKYLTRQQILDLLPRRETTRHAKTRKGLGPAVSAECVLRDMGCGNDLFMRVARERVVRFARRNID